MTLLKSLLILLSISVANAASISNVTIGEGNVKEALKEVFFDKTGNNDTLEIKFGSKNYRVGFSSFQEAKAFKDILEQSKDKPIELTMPGCHGEYFCTGFYAKDLIIKNSSDGKGKNLEQFLKENKSFIKNFPPQFVAPSACSKKNNLYLYEGAIIASGDESFTGMNKRVDAETGVQFPWPGQSIDKIEYSKSEKKTFVQFGKDKFAISFASIPDASNFVNLMNKPQSCYQLIVPHCSEQGGCGTLGEENLKIVDLSSKKLFSAKEFLQAHPNLEDNVKFSLKTLKSFFSPDKNPENVINDSHMTVTKEKVQENKPAPSSSAQAK